jgi:hypothetical protein
VLRDLRRTAGLRTNVAGGRSGRVLLGSGLAVLTLGTFAGVLPAQVAPGLSVLEGGVLLVGGAVTVALVRYLLGRLKRAVGVGALGALSLGPGIPVLAALPALPALGRRLRKVASPLVRRLP